MRDCPWSVHEESAVELCELFSEFFDLLQSDFAEFGLDRNQGRIHRLGVDKQLLPHHIDDAVEGRLLFADLRREK